MNPPSPPPGGASKLVAAAVFASALLVVSGAHSHQVPADRLAESPDGTTGAAQPHFYELVGFEIPDEELPVTVVFVGAPPTELSESDVEEAITTAVDTWNGVPCSYATIEWDGFRSSLQDVSDVEVPVYFGGEFDAESGRLAQTTLPSDSPPRGIEVRVDADHHRWSTQPHPFEQLSEPQQPIASLPAVLTHEFGHVLGLAHTDAHATATMAAGYLGDGSQTELSADDKLGLCSLYPTEGSECTEAADCPPSADCVDGEHGSVCDVYVGDTGDYCGVEFRRCRERCHIYNSDIGTGYCSARCDSDGDCPESFACQSTDLGVTQCRLDPASPEASCASTDSRRTIPPFAVVLLVVVVLTRTSRRGSPRTSGDGPGVDSP